jgi:nucleoside-diphosphate-sugar epimerase
MNILVTGGEGFIGHNVVHTLEKDNHRVTTYDNHTTYGILDSAEVKRLHSERRQFTKGPWITSDIRDLRHLEAAMLVAEPEVIVHMAAFPRAKVVNAKPVEGSDVMSSALMSLLMLSKMHHVKRFVYISSSMVYGDFDTGVTEDAVCNPKGTYAILKYAGELLVRDYCTTNNIEYVIVRPSAVYGPRDVEDRVLSKFLMNALRGEDIVVKGVNEVLDFSYVDDVAAGIALTATHKNAPGNVFNITRGVGLMLLTAAKMCVNIANSSSKIIVADKDESFPSRGALSIGNASSKLGYAPQWSLGHGLEKYYEWIQSTI